MLEASKPDLKIVSNNLLNTTKNISNLPLEINREIDDLVDTYKLTKDKIAELLDAFRLDKILRTWTNHFDKKVKEIILSSDIF